MQVLQVSLWRRVDSEYGGTERRCPAWRSPQSTSVERQKRLQTQSACLACQHPLNVLPVNGQFLTRGPEASLSQPPLQLGYSHVTQAPPISHTREPLDEGGNKGWKQVLHGIHFQVRVALGSAVPDFSASRINHQGHGSWG